MLWSAPGTADASIPAATMYTTRRWHCCCSRGARRRRSTVSAFTELRSRQTIISGTRAEATVTAAGVEFYSFADRRRRFFPADGPENSGLDASHGGGDRALVHRYLDEVGEPTDAGRAAFAEALRTHRVAFAIEEARRRKAVVDPRSLSGNVPACDWTRRLPYSDRRGSRQ